MNHFEQMGILKQRITKLEKALLKLANPVHIPKTEEAACLQIEVEHIANEALKK